MYPSPTLDTYHLLRVLPPTPASGWTENVNDVLGGVRQTVAAYVRLSFLVLIHLPSFRSLNQTPQHPVASTSESSLSATYAPHPQDDSAPGALGLFLRTATALSLLLLLHLAQPRTPRHARVPSNVRVIECAFGYDHRYTWCGGAT
jgi:hypothetical protein